MKTILKTGVAIAMVALGAQSYAQTGYGPCPPGMTQSLNTANMTKCVGVPTNASAPFVGIQNMAPAPSSVPRFVGIQNMAPAAAAPQAPQFVVGAPYSGPPIEPHFVALKRGMPSSYYEVAPGQPYSQAEWDQREALTKWSVATWFPGRPASQGIFEQPIQTANGWAAPGEVAFKAALPASAIAPAAAPTPNFVVGAPYDGPPVAPHFVPLKRGMPSDYYAVAPGMPYSQAEWDQREALTKWSGDTWFPGRPASQGIFEQPVLTVDGWTAP